MSDDLTELVTRQCGVIRRTQLYDAGWSRHQVDHEVDVGRWRQLAPEVFAVHNGALSPAQRHWLGVLHAGRDAALSHSTACTVAGLRGWNRTIIDVLTRKGQAIAKLPGYFFHQTRRPYRPWMELDAAPPRLNIAVAVLLNAERQRSPRSAIGVVAASVQQRLTTSARLLEVSRQISRLRYAQHLRVALADIGGGAESLSEIDIGRLCSSHDLQQPRRQVVRNDAHGRRRYLDCEWVLPDGTRVVLEVDGSFHLETEHWWRDMQRERSIVVSGRRVLRCSSIEIRLSPAEIVADLRAVGVPSPNGHSSR